MTFIRPVLTGPFQSVNLVLVLVSVPLKDRKKRCILFANPYSDVTRALDILLLI